MDKRTKLTVFGAIAVVELLSFLAYFYPIIGPIAITIIGLGVLAIGFIKPEAALSILLIELIIGSKGHMFSWHGETSFSVRMAIWAAVLASFIIKSLWDIKKGNKEIILKIKGFTFIKQYILLAITVIMGIVIGFFRNDLTNLISDANAWLYFLILLPFIASYYQAGKEKQKKIIEIVEIATIWLAIKTLIFLFLFSHKVVFLSELYYWIRQSGVGEVTAMTGGWQRIFIQSQIFSAIMLIVSLRQVVAYPLGKIKEVLKKLIKPSLYLATIILSMSRSFWLALGVVAVLVGIYLIFRKNWKEMLRLMLSGLITLAISVAIIFLVIRFPYPSVGGKFSVRAFSERTDIGNDEAAISSRWNLLGPLSEAVFSNPILGQGFGSTVTYKTEDPRLVASGKQDYTTYAFEWGYLGIALKLGALGLIAYLWLLYSLISKGFRKKDPLIQGLSLGIVLLAIIHVFTPYLDHPLGIAFLVISSCLIANDNV